MDGGKLGGQPESRLILGDSRIELPSVGQGGAEIDVGGQGIGVERQDRLIIADGVWNIALLLLANGAVQELVG